MLCRTSPGTCTVDLDGCRGNSAPSGFTAASNAVELPHPCRGRCVNARRWPESVQVGITPARLRLTKPNQEVHAILDNLSAHKTAKVEPSLRPPAPHTEYSFWLNQVETWLAHINVR